MPYIVVGKSCISGVRQQLWELKLLREEERIRRLDNGMFAIPVHSSAQPGGADCTSFTVNGKSYLYKQTIEISTTLPKKPCELIREMIEVYMKEKGVWREELGNEIPTSWVKYGDLILFTRDAFIDGVWKIAGDTLWQDLCKVLKVKRLGRINGIKPDGFRSPQVEIMYGDNSWVEVVDGHVKYTWDVRFCMFSPGNATERYRVAQMNCLNDTVVDMYAGIGYFTIPFLVHAKAACVHACEWNPHAVAALRKNLCNNKVSSRCYIHFGDNREVCPQNVADRVYLGLIPTCQPGIDTACKALKFHSGGILHLHENVTSWKNLSRRAHTTGASSVLNLECPLESTVTMASTNGETKVDLKNSSTGKPQCEKCQEIEKSFPDGLLGGIKEALMRCDGGSEFAHRGSFSVEGSEGITRECSSVVVNWKRKEWFRHALHLSHMVCSSLSCLHSSPWMVSVIDMHHVKSYAPHIDHIVYDLKCSPVTQEIEL